MPGTAAVRSLLLGAEEGRRAGQVSVLHVAHAVGTGLGHASRAQQAARAVSARWYLPALGSYTEVSKLPGRAHLKPTSQVKGTAAS